MDRHAGEDLARPASALGGGTLHPRHDYGAERGVRGVGASEDVLEACFAHASVGLLVVAADGTILRANAAFAAMLGMEPGEVVGHSVLALTHPEDRARLRDELHALAGRRRRVAEAEKRYLRKDGTTVLARVTAVPAFGADGTLSHQLVTVRDASEREALEAQLLEATTRFQRLVDANILGVTVATETAVLEANDELLRLAGITREQFEREGLDWRAITPPEFLPRDERGLREILERGACSPFEKEFRWPDGTRVPVLVGGALLEREPLKWIAFVLDLSDRRRAEQERDRHLEEARAARAVAEAALSARDALLARVTHDLRTPIGANLGYADLMLEAIPQPLPPVHEERVRRMRANQRHMLALLDELLHFMRSATDRGDLELEVIGVPSLIADVEPLVAPQLRAAGLTLAVRACEPGLQVLGERVKILQVLGNLIGNAAKFTPPRGRVTLAVTGVGEEVRIAVSDTGIGIAPAHLAHIFEPFVQVRDMGARTPGEGGQRGFGLGLAISRELARRMGGDLTATSEPGVGSTFTLVLPRP